MHEVATVLLKEATMLGCRNIIVSLYINKMFRDIKVRCFQMKRSYCLMIGH